MRTAATPAPAPAPTPASDSLDMLTKLADKLAQLDPRTRISLLLRLGVPAINVIGIESCTGHVGWRPLTDNESLAFDYTVLWCSGCHKWVRKR